MTGRPNTSRWVDLALVAGLFAFAYQLDRRIRYAGTEDSANGRRGAYDLRASQEPHDVQAARKNEAGRGREAATPTEIPPKGWLDVLWRVYREINNDRLLAVAAGVVFYMLLALFPGLAALVSLYGLVSDPAVINAHLSLLTGVVPVGAVDIMREQVNRLAEARGGALSVGFLLGLGLALWSANGGMKAIIDALNVVYDEREKRSFVMLNLISFAFTIGSVVLAFVALAAVVVTPLVLSWLGVDADTQVIALLRWPALLVAVLLWLAVLYRYGPSRTAARWTWLSVGSVLAAASWLAMSSLFSWYLSNFADYNATYGSLGAAMGMMMWLWLSVIVILVGGELNAEMEHQTAHDTTVPPHQPLGERGAVMADTVGKSWR